MTDYSEFHKLLLETGIPVEAEYRFVAELLGKGPGLRKRLSDAGLRDWRFDFALPAHKIYLEIQGSGWGHQRNPGFLRDMQKHNAAVKLGWRGLYFPAGTVRKNPKFVVEEFLSLL